MSEIARGKTKELWLLDLNSTINNQIHLLGKRKSTALARQNWPEAIRVDAKLEVLEWLRRELTKGQDETNAMESSH